MKNLDLADRLLAEFCDLSDLALDELLQAGRAAVGALIAAEAWVDVIVPRGGKSLTERISREARVPVIRHLDGICHVYIDDEADLDKAWKEEWSREADRVAGIGDKADAEGFAITAGNQYMRAGNYYYSAERFIAPGEDKLAMYRKALRCYQAAMKRLHPDIERVEVPYDGVHRQIHCP